MKKNIIGWIFFIIIILVVIGVVIKNWEWISKSFGGSKCKESDTPFECVRKKGGKTGEFIAANPGFPDMYDYPNSGKDSYRFYSDGKFIILFSSTQIKGTYNKEKVIFNDGTQKMIADIFSK